MTGACVPTQFCTLTSHFQGKQAEHRCVGPIEPFQRCLYCTVMILQQIQQICIFNFSSQRKILSQIIKIKQILGDTFVWTVIYAYMHILLNPASNTCTRICTSSRLCRRLALSSTLYTESLSCVSREDGSPWGGGYPPCLLCPLRNHAWNQRTV